MRRLLPGQKVVIQPDGKIVAVGFSGNVYREQFGATGDVAVASAFVRN